LRFMTRVENPADMFAGRRSGLVCFRFVVGAGAVKVFPTTQRETLVQVGDGLERGWDLGWGRERVWEVCDWFAPCAEF